MIVPAVIVMQREKWKLDRDPRSILYGLLIGLTGAGGQMVLFYAVTTGPAYLIFPIISLSPLVTILMSFALLKERTTRLGVLGVVLALIALPLFDFSPQGFVHARRGLVPAGPGHHAVLGRPGLLHEAGQRPHERREHLLLHDGQRPAADAGGAGHDRLLQADQPGLGRPWLAAGIQMLNAVGALFLVYAFRHGKAIVVAPLTNAGGPLVTAVISLLIAGVVPGELKMVGLALAVIASALLALAP